MVDIEKKIKSLKITVASINKVYDTVIKKVYLEYKGDEADIDTLISSKETILNKFRKFHELDEDISNIF